MSRLRTFVPSAGMMLIAGLAACNVVRIDDPSSGAGRGAAKASGGGAAPTTSALPGADDDADAPRAWGRGVWRSRFGDVEFEQDGAHAAGRYPGGTLDCAAKGPWLDCAWVDGTGSGRARFRWNEDGNATGTYGNGDSSDGEGPWDLAWSPGTATPTTPTTTTAATGGSTSGSSGSSSGGSTCPKGPVSVSLDNQCGHSVTVCIQRTGSGAYSRESFSGHSSSSRALDEGDTIRAVKGSSCGELLGTIGASTKKIVLCK